MDAVHEWTERLARDVAPSEADEADTIADRFLAGPASRHDLLQEARGRQSRAIGLDLPAVVSVLPFVLHAVTSTAPALLDLISSDRLAASLGIVAHGLMIGETRQHHKEKSPPTSEPPDRDATLWKTFDEMVRALQRSGMSRDECARISYQVFTALSEDREGATAFVSQLSAHHGP